VSEGGWSTTSPTRACAWSCATRTSSPSGVDFQGQHRARLCGQDQPGGTKRAGALYKMAAGGNDKVPYYRIPKAMHPDREQV
jgi:hypothetical protein